MVPSLANSGFQAGSCGRPDVSSNSVHRPADHRASERVPRPPRVTQMAPSGPCARSFTSREGLGMPASRRRPARQIITPLLRARPIHIVPSRAASKRATTRRSGLLGPGPIRSKVRPSNRVRPSTPPIHKKPSADWAMAFMRLGAPSSSDQCRSLKPRSARPPSSASTVARAGRKDVASARTRAAAATDRATNLLIRSKFNDAPLGRGGDGMGTVAYAQLAEDALDIRLDRLFGDAKLPSHLLV